MVTNSERIRAIEKSFGEGVVTGQGVNIAVKCPGCNENKKRKLEIRLADGWFHCWVCGSKGRNIAYIAKKYNKPNIDFLNKVYGSDVKYEVPEEEPDEIVEIPEGFVFLANNKDRFNPDIRDTKQYLFSRGITLRDMWYFRLGTCKFGDHRRHILMPSFDNNGDLNFLVARVIDKKNGRKYYNSNVRKKKIIFNELNVDWTKEVTLVEGPFDLMKCDDNAICMLGAEIPEDSLLFQTLIKHQTPVVFALDADAKRKSQNHAKKLSAYGNRVKLLDLGKFSDVGEMSKDEFNLARENAPLWTQNNRLKFLIKGIRPRKLI